MEMFSDAVKKKARARELAVSDLEPLGLALTPLSTNETPPSQQ